MFKWARQQPTILFRDRSFCHQNQHSSRAARWHNYLGKIVQRWQGLVHDSHPFDSLNHFVGETGQGGGKAEGIELVMAFRKIDNKDSLELQGNVSLWQTIIAG